jgi:hypothetical protein
MHARPCCPDTVEHCYRHTKGKHAHTKHEENNVQHSDRFAPFRALSPGKSSAVGIVIRQCLQRARAGLQRYDYDSCLLYSSFHCRLWVRSCGAYGECARPANAIATDAAATAKKQEATCYMAHLAEETIETRAATLIHNSCQQLQCTAASCPVRCTLCAVLCCAALRCAVRCTLDLPRRPQHGHRASAVTGSCGARYSGSAAGNTRRRGSCRACAASGSGHSSSGSCGCAAHGWPARVVAVKKPLWHWPRRTRHLYAGIKVLCSPEV